MQQAVGQAVAAAQKTRFQKSSVAGEVVVGALAQLFHAAHFHRRHQRHVPQHLDKGGNPRLLRLVRRQGQGDGQIQIGIRIHFATAKAADGQQTHIMAVKPLLPQHAQRILQRRAVLAEKHQGLAVRQIMLGKLLFLQLQLLRYRLAGGAVDVDGIGRGGHI